MRYLVFVQRGEAYVDLAAIVGNARRYFESEIDVVGASSPDGGATATRATLELASPRYGYSGRFELTARRAETEDWQRAETAELAGRAAGMGSLARRCAVIWELEPLSPSDPCATLNLCALLASVALGPVLPPDDSTLLGVRSSMKRVEELVAERQRTH